MRKLWALLKDDSGAVNIQGTIILGIAMIFLSMNHEVFTIS